jgi:glucose/arabinose dehydrogenase
MPPGSYTVAAASITIGQTQYAPLPVTQNVTITAGATASTAVAYSAPVSLRLNQVASGLTRPVHLVSPANDPRLFVVEQTGRIKIIQNGQVLATAFLDLTAKIFAPSSFGDEQGLLGLAFHPQYATNGFFFVFYVDPTQYVVVERYQVSANANVANSTGTVVLRVPHLQSLDHNGGGLAFGTDGYLYISIGDGGCCYDPSGNGQNLNALLGKILRIDVSTLPYTVPASNPFVGQAGRLPEIWAYGLRNPWRFDIDPANGTVFIADVGEDDREEVNAIASTAAGPNFGWPLAEGTLCLLSGCTNPALRTPIIEYDHGQGCSITGGFVYRGMQIPELQGHYFYSDWCEGFLRSVLYVNGTLQQSKSWPVPSPGNVTSFGKGGNGELYVLTQAGLVLQIVRQ